MQFSTIAALSLLTGALAAPLAARDGWTIRSFTRACPDDNSCTYEFTIDTGAGTQACTVVDTTAPALTHPWYGVPCQENSNYQASWGWDYAGDFTVMTIVQENTQLEAFFGYSHPNTGLPGTVTYADVGPNAVQSTGA